MDEVERKKDSGVHFSPRKSKSKTCCCVFGCKSYAKKNPTLRFHAIPKANVNFVEFETKFGKKEKIDRRSAWIKKLKIDKNFGPNARVCSLHFKEDDYIVPVIEFPSSKKILNSDTVPSLNIPLTQKEIRVNELYLKRKRRIIKREVIKSSSQQIPVLPLINEEVYVDLDTANLQTSNTLELENQQFVDSDTANVQTSNILELENKQFVDSDTANVQTSNTLELENKQFVDATVQVNVETTPKTFVDIGVQVNHKFINFIKTEKDLYTVTGLSKFEDLIMLEGLVLDTVKQNVLQSYTKLEVKDRIVMTLIKLKLNLSYRILTVLFQVFTEENCRKIVLNYIDILSKPLIYAIHWPEKEEIRKNIPQCFNEFLNVRAVVDVIELSIQTPKPLCCRSGFFSAYKGTHTVRFMTAVTPGGIISFVSKPYMGRTSDKAIFETSNFIKLFDIGDGVMTDKGFLVDDLCLQHNVQLIRPPFLTQKNNLLKKRQY